MIRKFLEKKVEIEYDEVNQNPVNKLELEYYLLESEYTENESKGGVLYKTYGIEIIKRHNGSKERKQFESIFNTREKTKSLVNLLADNTVTPSTLPYVLDDLLGV